MFTSSLVIGSGANAKTYTAADQAQIFGAYINQDKYLKTRKGQYAERNGAVSPWRNQVDFRLTQEVFKNVSGTKNSFQFTMDIFNVGNFLNKNWGAVNFVNSTNILVPQNVSAISATTKPTFKMANAGGDIVRETFGTVSYTHLDVYKRQDYYSIYKLIQVQIHLYLIQALNQT